MNRYIERRRKTTAFIDTVVGWKYNQFYDGEERWPFWQLLTVAIPTPLNLPQFPKPQQILWYKYKHGCSLCLYLTQDN